MSQNIRLQSFGRTCVRALLIAVILTLAALPRPAIATDLTVDCSGASGYTSITSALAALQGDSFHRHKITVSGTCRERIDIRDFPNLQIIGTTGATIEDPDGVPGPPVVWVNGAAVFFQRLKFLGKQRPGIDLVRVLASRAVFDQCILEKSGGHGIAIDELSQVDVLGSTIQDNGGNGIWVSGGSLLTTSDQQGATMIQRNQNGIDVRGNAVARVNQSTLIQQNVGNGISVQSARLFTSCNPGQGKILANGGSGITVSRGTVEVTGTLIQDNAGIGVSLNGSSGSLSKATIQGNGPPGFPPGAAGGVCVTFTSTLNSSDTKVINNNNRGITVHFDSSVTLFSTVVSGNTTDGLRVEQLSSALVVQNSQLTNNAGTDLFCSPDSAAFGSKEGIGKMFCPGFNQTPLPHWD